MPFERPCTIRRAGIRNDGKVLLDLKAVDGTAPLADYNWRAGRADMTRELLAIALAAITSEKLVNVHIPDPVNSSDIAGMQLIK